MENPRSESGATSLGGLDSRIYGVVWVGLIAAAVGAMTGLVLMTSSDASVLLGAATTAVSVAVGALVYLVSKVLDRQ